MDKEYWAMRMSSCMTKDWKEINPLEWENKKRKEQIKIIKKSQNKNKIIKKSLWLVKVQKFNKELTIGENISRKSAIEVVEQYMRTHLNPNCSEYVSRLGIKKSELPYIKKRIKELIPKEEQDDFFKNEFMDWVDKGDSGGNFMNTDDVVPYEKIKEELLAKRNDICPFCKEKIISPSHFKEHKEEIKNVLKHIDKNEYSKLKKEIIVDNL